MALTKVNRGGLNTGVSDSSDATAITINSSEQVSIGTTSTDASALLTLNKSPTAAFGNPLLQVGGSTYTSGGYYSIGLGYTNSTYTEPPAEIAYVPTSDSGGTKGILVFGTRNATTNTAVTERMRIDASGHVFVGATAEFVDSSGSSAKGIQLHSDGLVIASRDGSVSAIFGRSSDDGQIVQLRQDGSTEGTISVSGSTVSYGGFVGLHESSGIATSTPIGTVVSTIDELDVYPVDTPKAGQNRADHAKVKVSDTVGDKRVYGVVQKFDAEYYNKLQVASVGIGSVRVTGSCAGGDLLESNGDGTAKVQSDDIVRSKTIGKVTIGNSDTGVKLVSCVLYCG